MPTVLLVRHADSVHPNDWSGNEYTRPLSERGVIDARELGDSLSTRRIDVVCSSPYRRAMQSVEPLAVDRGLHVQLVHDFREHRLTPQPVPNWRDILEAAWLDFRAAPGGADALAFTQHRALAALDALRARHGAETIAIGGHGMIFASVLHAIHPGIDLAFLLAMPMPAVYELSFADGRWAVHSGPGIEAPPGQ